MKDYSAMSDYLINQHVAESITGRYLYFPDYVWDSEEEKRFDPCNKPADAWPIITANKISIIPRVDLWVAVKCSFVIDIDTPRLKSFIHASHSLDIPFCVNENPLKAAMIVYLQMMEQKL